MKRFIVFSMLMGVICKSSGQTILNDSEADGIINSRRDSLPRYFDSHIHCTNMGYYNHIPKASDVLTGNYSKEKIQYINWTGNRKEITDKKGNNAKNYGQADYGRLKLSGASIVCTSITPVEKRFTKGWLKRTVNSLLVTRYSCKRLKTTNSTPSYDEFMGEYNFMLAQSHDQDGSGIIKPVKNKTELINNFKAGNTSVLISLEGGHIFDGKNVSFHDIYKNGIFSQASQNDILANIDSIKNLPYKVFFVTLGHFAWNGIAGFAKSLDENKSGLRGALLFLSGYTGFRKWLFRKYSDGILEYTYKKPPRRSTCFDNRDTLHYRGTKTVIRTTIGFKVIKKLLDTTGNKNRIYIDVKHMDIKARLQYYQYLKENKLQVPIIFSHGAVSGKNLALATYTGLYPNFDLYQEVKAPYDLGAFRNACIKEKGISYNMKKLGWFYPWSINLADEEIPIIYNSDGIIGITLDERLLGGKRPNYKQDQDSLDDYVRRNLINAADAKTFSQMQPFFRNIFYIIEHCGKTDNAAWDHLVIGTDFDGFIKPVEYCPTAEEIPALRQLIIKFLPLYQDYVYHNQVLSYNLTSTQIANKLIFENGERFALKYY